MIAPGNGTLWVLIFGCWLTYLGAPVFFPRFWRIAWFQMILIVILLGDLGYGIWTLSRST